MSEASSKPKKSKKHAEDAGSSEASPSNASPVVPLAVPTPHATHIVVQSADSGESSSKKRTSRGSVSVSAEKPNDSKTKDKVKDKERKKLAKEASHSAPSTPVPSSSESAVLHSAEVYKYAGRFKGTPPLPLPPNHSSPSPISRHFARE